MGTFKAGVLVLASVLINIVILGRLLPLLVSYFLLKGNIYLTALQEAYVD